MRLLIIFFILTPLLLFGQQDSVVLLTKNFKFTDGIYLDFEEFKTNKPGVTWDSVYARLHSNPQNLITLVDTIHYERPESGALGEIWGFSLGGIPYINYDQKNPAGLNKFIGLKVRGAICYYFTEKVVEKAKLIRAYNPVTGIPFREGEVMTKSTDREEYMLSFETGEIAKFDVENFLNWIAEDKKLVKTVRKLDDKDKSEKLFKCLLIYDDRNPRYVPVHD